MRHSPGLWYHLLLGFILPGHTPEPSTEKKQPNSSSHGAHQTAFPTSFLGNRHFNEAGLYADDPITYLAKQLRQFAQACCVLLPWKELRECGRVLELILSCTSHISGSTFV